MRQKRAGVVTNAVKTLCAGSLGSHANNITSLLPVSVLRPSPSRSTRYTSLLETSLNRDLSFCLPLSNSFSPVQLARDRFMPAVSVLVQCAVCPAHWSVLSGHVWLRACGTSTFEAVGIVNNLNNFEFQIRPRRFSLVRHGFVQETLRIRRPNLKEGDLGIRNSWRHSLQFVKKTSEETLY